MTNDNSAAIVSKVWNYADVLKNAGVGYGLPVRQAGDYVEVRAARALITYLLLAPTFGFRAIAQPCGLPVSPLARLLKLAPPSIERRRAGDEMTELGRSKVAGASSLSSEGKDQRRDASATILRKMPRLRTDPPCFRG